METSICAEVFTQEQYFSSSHFSVPFFLARFAAIRMTGERSVNKPVAFVSDIARITARWANFLGSPFLSVNPSSARLYNILIKFFHPNVPRFECNFKPYLVICQIIKLMRCGGGTVKASPGFKTIFLLRTWR